MSYGETVGSRICRLREARGWSQAQLAKKAGISQSVISELESGDQKESRKLHAIAKAFGDTSAEYLATGRNVVAIYEPMPESWYVNQYGRDAGRREFEDQLSRWQIASGKEGDLMPANVTQGPEITKELPLISWVQAGSWANVEDPYHVGDAERMVPVTKRYSRRAFALRVSGESMIDPSGNGPSFPPGCIICVEPEADPVAGMYVIVRLENSMEATFKQLVNDSGRLYLRPLNPRYPLMDLPDDSIFVGVVKQMVMDF